MFTTAEKKEAETETKGDTKMTKTSQKTGTNLTKHAEKVFIIEATQSDCFTAWKKDQAEKKAVYDAAKETYEANPTARNQKAMNDAWAAWDYLSAANMLKRTKPFDFIK